MCAPEPKFVEPAFSGPCPLSSGHIQAGRRLGTNAEVAAWKGGSRELPTRRTLSFGRSTSHAEARLLTRREKSQQIGVHFVLVGRAQAVRRAWIGFQRGPFDQLGREQGRGADRHDLVVVAMDDESR